jgi:hypothetical protein
VILFHPSRNPGPLSSSYCLAPHAVEARILKLLQKGLAIILPPIIAQYVPDVNLINVRVGLDPKKEKEAGRLTTNPSSNSSRASSRF